LRTQILRTGLLPVAFKRRPFGWTDVPNSARKRCSARWERLRWNRGFGWILDFRFWILDLEPMLLLR